MKATCRYTLGVLLLLAASLCVATADAKQGDGKQVRSVALILLGGESGTEQSFRDTLDRSGFDIRYTRFDAGGSVATLRKHVEQLAPSKYDLIYASGASAAETTLQFVKERPVVVTLDLASASPSALENLGDSRNATGAVGQISVDSGLVPLSRVVKLRKLGVIRYHPALGSDYSLDQAQKRFDIRVAELPVSESDPVPAVLKRISDAKVDAVFFPSGAVSATNAEALMAGLAKRGIPSLGVPGASPGCKHLLLALRPDPAELGRRAAQNALALLKGSRPSQLPWRSVRTAAVTVDFKVADRMGISLPLQVAALSQSPAPQPGESPPSPLGSVSQAELLIILRALACMVLIVTVGVVIGRWDDWLHQQALIKLNDCIFLPCLVFFALHRHRFDPVELLQMAVTVTAVLATLGLVVLSLNGRKGFPREKLIAAVSMTSGTVLLPLSFLLFGEEGLAKAVYFHLLSLLLYHAFGSLSGNTFMTLRQFVKIPSLYVALAAVALAAAPLSVSGGLLEFAWLSEKGVEMTGMGAIPLLLLSFGYPLGQLRFSTIRLGLAGGGLRMVVSPALALAVVLVLRGVGGNPGGLLPDLGFRTSEAILVLGAAMPTSHYALRLGIPGRYPHGDGESGTILLTSIGAAFTVGMVLVLIAAFILR